MAPNGDNSTNKLASIVLRHKLNVKHFLIFYLEKPKKVPTFFAFCAFSHIFSTGRKQAFVPSGNFFALCA